MKRKTKQKTISALLLVAVVMMLAILSVTSVVGTDISETEKRSDSPLYRIRTKNAIKEQMVEIRNRLKATYISERVFIIPFMPLIKSYSDEKQSDQGQQIEILSGYRSCKGSTIYDTNCYACRTIFNCK